MKVRKPVKTDKNPAEDGSTREDRKKRRILHEVGKQQRVMMMRGTEGLNRGK